MDLMLSMLAFQPPIPGLEIKPMVWKAQNQILDKMSQVILNLRVKGRIYLLQFQRGSRKLVGN